MNTGLLWDNLLTYSLQIGLLVGVIGFVPSILGLEWARARLMFWQLLLATCLLLPLMRPWQRPVIVDGGISATTRFTAAAPAPKGPASRSIPRSEIALLLLAGGALLRLGWLGVGFHRLARYRAHSKPFRSQNGCPVFLSDEVSSPVTFGWPKPVILLPARFPALDPRVQEAILCHERLHVERRDWLFAVGEEVIRAIFWFHPAIWWLLGEIQLAREQAVDREVIDRTEARDEYVDALLTIAGAQAQLELAPAPLFLRKRHLKHRVVSIFKEVRMSRTNLLSRLAMGTGILAVACWVVTGTFRLAAAPQVVSDAPGVSVDTGSSGLLHRAPVSYPEALRRKGVQGTVTVEASLDASGNVSDARVLSGPDELRKPALQSVLQWHFQASGAGSTRTVNIQFQLTPQGAEMAQRRESLTIQAMANLTKAQQQLELSRAAAPPTPRTLKSLNVVGLSDQARADLLAHLPLHEGDTLNNDSLARLSAAVREFDEHLIIGTRLTSNDAAITVTAPNTTEGATTVNTTGPKLVRQVRPVYPALAKQARVSGEVKFQAIIDANGAVKNIEVVSGHPLLVPAAIDAVKNWMYEPTLLNGSPVEVKTEIVVTFALSE